METREGREDVNVVVDCCCEKNSDDRSKWFRD
jgi:hypothetical protein